MPVKRLQRWTIINTTLLKCLVFSEPLPRNDKKIEYVDELS